MSIEALLKAVPPPSEPVEAFVGPWEPVEAELGTALPQDYKDFARLYGRGYFMEFLGVDIPRTRNPNTRLELQVGITSNSYRFIFTPHEPPFPLWPDPQGLMSFGGTDNGDTLFWHRCGSPDAWTVMISDGVEFESLDCNLTGFLAGLASGQVQPKLLPDDMLPCDRLFQPDNPRPPPHDAEWKIEVQGRFGASSYRGVGAVLPGPPKNGGGAQTGLPVRLRMRLTPRSSDDPGD